MIGIAWAALFLWPAVAYIFFRNLSLPVALIATLLGGYLLLPANILFDVPLLPAMNKGTIPTIAALALTILAIRQIPQTIQIAPGWMPRSIIVRILMLLLLIGAVGTVLTNRDALYYGGTFLPGLTIRDAISAIFRELLLVLIPILLGRKILSSSHAQRTLLKAIVISALLYSLLALWEVRMSPQLHIQLYGFFPHSFAQQMRDGGFRPVVFLGHGLAVAMFFVTASIAAAALIRDTKGNERLQWVLALVWLIFVLVLCKSLGPLIIAFFLLPGVLFLNFRVQLLMAMCIACTILAYPLLRSTDMVPVDRALNFVSSINADRANSLNIRLVNEDRLLKKVMERPVFGWGGWGRARVYNERGHDISLTDGAWVTEMGYGGWVRYIAFFGLICWPIIRHYLHGGKKVDAVCMGLLLLLCAQLVDLIPNSGVGVITWLSAGALIGRLEMNAWRPPATPPRPSYTRNLSQALGSGRGLSSPNEDVIRRTQSDPERRPTRRTSLYSRFNTLESHHK